MKIFIAVVLAIGSVSALGSGPYLPSGWRPQGPAFFLPSENQKSPDSPLKETLFQETEASGSDALREYGPRKFQEVSQDLSNQGLPDVVTEQTFISLETSLNQEGTIEAVDAVVERLGTEVNTEQKSEIIEEIATATESLATATEYQAIEEFPTIVTESQSIATESLVTPTESEVIATDSQATPTESQAIGTESQATLTESQVTETQSQFIVDEITTEESDSRINAGLQIIVEETPQALQESAGVVTDTNVEVTQQEVEATVASVEERIEKVDAVVEEVKAVQEGVNNIADALVQLENEVKSEQIQSVEEIKEVKINQDSVGSLHAPEGFLEYGPPGFREYGPPKQDVLLRTAADVQEPSAVESIETNETRRRRFSPKFRSSKNKKIH